MADKEVDSDGPISYLDLLRTRRGKRRRSRRLRHICIGGVAVAAIIIIIGLSVGLYIKSKNESRTQATTADWLKTSCANTGTSACSSTRGNPLLLVGLSGLRADYLHKHKDLTPVIHKLQGCGVQTPYMRPVYPTKTDPNLYTIVTGLYPETHGIVNDKMYDMRNNKLFTQTRTDPSWWGGEPGVKESHCGKRLYPESHGIVNDKMYDVSSNKLIFTQTRTDPSWWGGKPLWRTAKNQNKKSASCKWPGSDVETKGQPELSCDGSMTNEDMVNKVVGWLKLSEAERPDFITLFFDQPGQLAQKEGPDSAEVLLKIKEMDGVIGTLMTELYRNHLDHCVNVIIVSDHGMSETDCLHRRLDFGYYMEDSEMSDAKSLLWFDGTTGSLFVNYKQHGTQITHTQSELSVDDIMDGLACRNLRLKIYTNQTIPIRHHYSNNDRIGNIVLDVEDKWLLLPDEESTCPKGSSGYDEAYESMHAMFLAYGPDFKHNIVTEPFDNIELYNIMAELLQITPADNNGTRGTLSHVLKNGKPVETEGGIEAKTCLRSNYRQQSTCLCDGIEMGPGFEPPSSPNEDTFPLGVPILHDSLSVCQLNERQLTMGNFAPPSSPNKDTFPLGVPILQDSLSVCQLYGRQFTVLYSQDKKQPVLSSYQLTDSQAENYKSEESVCIIPDDRLTDSVNPDCEAYRNENQGKEQGIKQGIELVYLFDPGFKTTDNEFADSRLSSNIVPMYTEFKEETWEFLWKLVKEYAIMFKQIHVSVGPIFDRNIDGKADLNDDFNIYVNNNSDIPIPSHYYMILTKCKNRETSLQDCSEDHLDILSFVLPHVKEKSNCEDDADYLRSNMARVRDIELLTGMRMLTKFTGNIGARKRTFLPTDIWPSNLLAHWVDLPCDTGDVCNSDYRPLLLISFDGFRADYVKRNLTKTISKLRQCGVQTPYMRSMFPTETYPNHYTMITGLYPESHGIVENYMYDPEINKEFNEFTEHDSRWWNGEPLWVTAKKQNKQTASMFWFGDNVNDKTKQPNLKIKLTDQESYRYEDGIGQLIDWMLLDKGERPEFITFYVEEPDITGHEFGPNSPQIDDMLKYVDSLIEQLMDGLYRNRLHNCVNIIIVSDHGMASESCQQQVALEPLYPNIRNVLTYLGTTGIINTNYREENISNQLTVVPNTNAPTAAEVLQALECKKKYYDIFTKETQPVRYHYANNDRIGDLVLDASNAWMIRIKNRQSCGKGNHGYDPAYKSMQAFFLAHGPAFKRQFKADSFENVELYNLMCDVLGITPSPNNGTLGSLTYMLQGDHGDDDRSSLLDIQICNSMEERTSSCSCDTSVPVVQSGVHTYHGGLALQDERLSVCSLTNTLFATVYSQDNKQPIMISALLTPKQISIQPLVTQCVLPEVRLTEEENPDCDKYENKDKNIIRVQLFDSRFAISDIEKQEIQLSTNLVPMYEGFFNNIWEGVLSTITKYLVTYKTVHVSVGPIVDQNYDGKADLPDGKTKYVKSDSTVPIPTHYFIILVKCNDVNKQPDDCDPDNIDILSFILPHVTKIPNCRKINTFMKNNLARLRDIELLTGLKYLTSYEWKLAARKRTRIPTEMWSFD